MNIKTAKAPLLRQMTREQLTTINALAERVLELERAQRQSQQAAHADIVEIDRRLTAGGH